MSTPLARFHSTLLAVGTLLAALLIGFYLQWTQLAALWTNEIGSAHGWLVLALSLWSTREVLRTPLMPGALARVPPLLTVIALYAAASAAHVDIVMQLAIPLTAVSLTYVLFDGAGVRAVRFGALYFLFTLPLWSALVSPLQHLTVVIVSHVLPIFGIAADGQDILIRIPGASFEVSEGCAGSHFLVVALAVSTLTNRAWALPPRRALFSVALAVSFALLANWLRVLFIIARAYSTDMHTSLVRDHYWFGWGVFATTLGVYFLILRRLDTGAARIALSIPSSYPAFAQFKRGGVVLALTALALLGVKAREQAANQSVLRLPAPTAVSSAWSGPTYATSNWQPNFPGATDSDLTTYRNAGGEVSWYRVLYAHEHTGAKLVGYGSSVVPEGWRVFKQQRVQAFKNGHYAQLPEWVLETQAADREGRVHRVWSWYEWDGAPVTRAWEVKLKQALSAFELYRPHGAGLEAFEAPCVPDCATAAELLERFARDRMSSGNP